MKTEKEFYLEPVAICITVISEHMICHSGNANIEGMDEEEYVYQI